MPRAARRARARGGLLPAGGEAGALAARLLLGGEALLAAAQELRGAGQQALVTGLGVELVEVPHERARSRAEEEHRPSAGHDLDCLRRAEGEAQRRRVLLEELRIRA